MKEQVMSRATISATVRPESGKGPSRRLRTSGLVPAVLYGGGKDPLSLSLDPRLLTKALDPALKRNTLLMVEVEGMSDAGGLVMVKDAQMDRLRDEIIHVDLIRVTEDQPVDTFVPLELTGRAEGVKLGGVIQQVFRDLPVRAPAGSIPASITADTTTWLLHFQFRVSDLQLPPGVTVRLDPKQKIAAVVTARAEVEPKAATEAEGEAALPSTEAKEEPES
jgi:large subunit ribosomal protein L25